MVQLLVFDKLFDVAKKKDMDLFLLCRRIITLCPLFRFALDEITFCYITFLLESFVYTVVSKVEY
jgi:hypothetical protein